MSVSRKLRAYCTGIGDTQQQSNLGFNRPSRIELGRNRVARTKRCHILEIGIPENLSIGFQDAAALELPLTIRFIWGDLKAPATGRQEEPAGWMKPSVGTIGTKTEFEGNTLGEIAA